MKQEEFEMFKLWNLGGSGKCEKNTETEKNMRQEEFEMFKLWNLGGSA